MPSLSRFHLFLALAALSGVGVALSAPGVVTFLPAKAMGWLAWVALVPLFLGISEVSVGKAALLGWVANMSLQLIAMAWFPGLIARFGGLHPVLAVLSSLLVTSAQALGWAGWAAAIRWGLPRWPLPIIAPITFMAMEYTMPLIFPYTLGITQYENLTIAQSAEVGGIHLVGGWVVMFNAAWAHVFRWGKRRIWAPIVANLLIGLALLSGAMRLNQVRIQRENAPSMRVGWVQAARVQRGWQAGVETEHLVDYQRLSVELESEAAPLDLMVWPEKAYGLLLRSARHDYPPTHPARIRKGFQTPLLFGHTSVDKETREVRNAAAFLESKGRLRVVYEKVRLIVYSEWVPSWLEKWVGKRYRPGTIEAPVDVQGVNVGVFICFESTFPAHIREIAKGSSMLVNLSDDTWFGDTAEPEQHLAHAVFRAIENRRDVVRATGGGVSALVGATGEVLVRTELNRQELEPRTGWGVVHRLENRSWYGRVGDVVPLVSFVISVVLLGWGSVRDRRLSP